MPSSNSCISSGQSCGSSSNFPQFIDSASCLCGLVNDPEPSRNGNTAQDWRCIGDATKDVGSGTSGKWFNTTLGSEELSGINQPLNWGGNPPDTSQASIVVMVNGKNAFQKLGSDGSSSLKGNDGDCTGKNDTSMSAQYYGFVSSSNSSSNSTSGMSHSMMSSMMSSSMTSSMTASSMASSMASMASATATMATGGSMTTGSSPSATSSGGATSTPAAGSAGAPRAGYKALMLVGMLLAPIVALTA